MTNPAGSPSIPHTSASLLITYATAGAGHRRAAEAIAQAARTQFPDADVQCVDVLDYTPQWFRRGYAWSYLLLVRSLSWVWKLSYALLDCRIVYRCVQPLRRAWNLWIATTFVKWVAARQPDVVITTHFFPADLCSAGKRAGWLRSALVVVVTDLHPHQFWISLEPEAMVVATPESAEVLQRHGVAAERTHVLGIPIASACARRVDRAALQQRCGFTSERLTVLVTSGGTTVGQFEQVVRALAALEAIAPRRVQLLVVCGEDEGAKQRLAQRARGSAMPIHVFGFIDDMADVMAVSDLIVAKAGGLTVSEALGRGVPLILYHIIPGQERMNAQYVSRHGAALIAHGPRAVANAVHQLARDPSRVEAMRTAAQALGRPHAAEAIVSQVIRPLLDARCSTPQAGCPHE